VRCHGRNGACSNSRNGFGRDHDDIFVSLAELKCTPPEYSAARDPSEEDLPVFTAPPAAADSANSGETYRSLPLQNGRLVREKSAESASRGGSAIRARSRESRAPSSSRRPLARGGREARVRELAANGAGENGLRD